jgi:hypothetical protein
VTKPDQTLISDSRLNKVFDEVVTLKVKSTDDDSSIHPSIRNNNVIDFNQSILGK